MELVFRAGRSAVLRPGERTFSIDPDEPTGVAGCAFVTGSGLRMGRTHALFDYRAPPEASGLSASYEGLLVAPLVDWRAGSVPLGAIYLTTTTGTVFALDQSEITAWLQAAGLAVLDRLKS